MFVRRESLQAVVRRQLDINAHSVCEHAETGYQRVIRARDRLGVDISAEPVFFAQNTQSLNHTLAGIIGTADDGGREEKPLDIIAAIKFIVSSASSRGENVARRTSLETRLTQYLQSKTQALLMRTFSRDIHLPSAAKLWHMPHAAALLSHRRLRICPFRCSCRRHHISPNRKVSPACQTDPRSHQISNICSYTLYIRTFVCVKS